MEPLVAIHPGANKWDIRQKVWDYIEEKNLADFPRPVHNRIPNFKNAAQACNRLGDLQEFKSSQTVKINPDRPQQQARFVTLEANKTLLVPTPRLRSGLFNRITPPAGANKEQLRKCSTSQGVKEFSVPVGLDAKVKVDLVVVGSVAVSEKGLRIGKGEGYADLEYGMMTAMGAVNESTVVVTVVHDCQVVNIPEELIESHDLTVDYILTPTRVIQTNCQLPKPQGIIWSKLDSDKLEKIPILKKLRAMEEEAGKDVTLGAVPDPAGPAPQAAPSKRQNKRRPRPRAAAGDEGKQNHKEDNREEPEQEPEQKPRQRPPRVRKESRGEAKGTSEGEPRERKPAKAPRERKERNSEGTGGEGVPRRRYPNTVTTVHLGGIPNGLRVSELKTALREREAAPLRLTWQGAQHRAFLDYSDPEAADRALQSLQGLSLNGADLQAALAKNQRGGRRPFGANKRPRPPSAPEAASGEQTEVHTPPPTAEQ
ncbi:methenyltetrahydrofolate synthase domain-containing protein isoform X2 [Synchiropus splendidus]|uniref:methenyltetrahydrofolate synthase domain-containing protein isoform X2 n=1 Tax=Synchiropus splendidus TaxID=270530 RepID=UPI00237E41FB|nr:methenyltetrahydrofolate synthase domain-containing protein isoform X2 [Synchiropus splendidus]